MSLPPPEHESFKTRFRQTLEAQGMSVYRLARIMNPDNPEQQERLIRKWLSPSHPYMPSLASRLALARALGVPEDFFDPRPGVREMNDIARLYAHAELMETVLLRRVWCAPGGPYGGHYLTAEQRELVEV